MSQLHALCFFRILVLLSPEEVLALTPICEVVFFFSDFFKETYTSGGKLQITKTLERRVLDPTRPLTSKELT